jgi:hypothetical protein
MVFLHTKNPNSGLFRKALEWKILVCLFYAQLIFVRPFGMFCYIFRVLVHCTKKNLATLGSSRGCYFFLRRERLVTAGPANAAQRRQRFRQAQPHRPQRNDLAAAGTARPVNGEDPARPEARSDPAKSRPAAVPNEDLDAEDAWN